MHYDVFYGNNIEKMSLYLSNLGPLTQFRYFASMCKNFSMY